LITLKNSPLYAKSHSQFKLPEMDTQQNQSGKINRIFIHWDDHSKQVIEYFPEKAEKTTDTATNQNSFPVNEKPLITMRPGEACSIIESD